MKLIYGEELDLQNMTLREIHEMEVKTGIRFIFQECMPVAIQVPCEMPGMVAVVALK